MFKNLLSKVGWGELPSSFGFVLGDKVELPFQSVWQQHKGQKRSDGSAVSIFMCPKKDADMVQVAAAKNAMMSKSLKHPNIIVTLDTCETDAGIYIATEAVQSLLMPEAPEEAEADGTPNVWGLYQALDALSFLHTAGFVHGLFGPSSIFVSATGDYRLFGFELCKKGANAGDLLAGWRRCGPKLAGWAEPPASLFEGGGPTSAVDFWGAVVLAAYVFGSARPGRGRGVDCRVDLAKATQDFPPELRKPLAELQKVGPLRGRSPIAEIIALQYLQQHPAIHIMAFLNSLFTKSPEEKEAFFEALPTMLDKVPQSMQMRQVLPDLLSAQKFPGNESAQVLPSILKIAARLKNDEFAAKVAPLVVQLFASPDRTIRFRLLMSIGDMIGNLDDAMINDKIFPECANGFSDSAGPIREATVKALVHFVPRLKAKTLETRVTKLILKLLSDPEASIRTNAVICCGQISGHLPKSCAAQTLGQALSAGLKDPFSPCRSASLHTLLATCALFSVEELANRMLPQVCLRLVDPDPSVTDNAFKVLHALQIFLKTQIDERRAAQALEGGHGSDSAQAPAEAENAAGTWGSWAMTAGSKLSTLGTLVGSMSTSKQRTESNADNTPTTPSSNSAAPVPPAPPATAPTVASQPRTASGMSLNSGKKAEPSCGGGWGDDDDDMWDDFDADAPAKSAPVAPVAVKAPVVRAAPKPVAAAKVTPGGGGGWGDDDDLFAGLGEDAPKAPPPRAAPKPVAAAPKPVAAKATLAPKAKPKAANLAKDEDDFWNDFDM